MSPAVSAAAAPGRLDIHSSAEFEVVQTIRERPCCSSISLQKGEALEREKMRSTPARGQYTPRGAGTVQGPKLLFRQDLVRDGSKGAPQGAGLCHPQVQPGPLWPLFPNIVLSNGSMLLRLRDRSLREVQRLAPKDPDLPLQGMFNDLTQLPEENFFVNHYSNNYRQGPMYGSSFLWFLCCCLLTCPWGF